MKAGKTETLGTAEADIRRAAGILRAGGTVAFPTETVYGLGADAANGKAVARIFEAKGRPRFNPLIAHVADSAAAQAVALFTPDAERLAAAFWPGPLTLVLPLAPAAAISPLVTAGNASVAVRVPAHPVARRLLSAFGGAVAAPSANPSGRVSPTRAEHVLEGLSGRIDAVVDAGPCPVGVESTIVGLSADSAVLLRPGGLPAEAIEACLGRPLGRPRAAPGAAPSAPGQLSSHYAPAARLRLGVAREQAGPIWLGFGPGCEGATRNLSPSGDLAEAAANLFHYLRALDRMAGPGGAIDVAPIPEHGLGAAINDRLRRAAAPRDTS